MRGMLIVTASLMLGLIAISATVSEVAAQDNPGPPRRERTPPPPTPPKKVEPPKKPQQQSVKVVYRSRNEHDKRFQSASQAEDFARRLRAEGFSVEIHPRRQNNEVREFEVEYRLRQERTKVFTGPQANANANAFASFLRGLRVDARVIAQR